MNKKKKAPLEKLEQYRKEHEEVNLLIDNRRNEIEKDIDWVAENWMSILFKDICTKVKEEEKAKKEEEEKKKLIQLEEEMAEEKDNIQEKDEFELDSDDDVKERDTFDLGMDD